MRTADGHRTKMRASGMWGNVGTDGTFSDFFLSMIEGIGGNVPSVPMFPVPMFQDGKWQYRAKPGDVADNHIHLEELNPKTGGWRSLNFRKDSGWPMLSVSESVGRA